MSTPADAPAPGEDVDLRGVLDPLAVVAGARPRMRHVPERVIPAPELGGEAADLPDTIIPAHVEVGPDPALLPDELLMGGQPDLRKLVGLALAAIAQSTDQVALSVTGRTVLTSGTLVAGRAREVDVTWDDAPHAVPTDVTALALAAMPGAAGRLRARVIPDSVTTTGCRVAVVLDQGRTSVILATSLPVAVEAVGRYVWTPPFTEEETP